jgi:PAS domain S-box-containing protein
LFTSPLAANLIICSLTSVLFLAQYLRRRRGFLLFWGVAWGAQALSTAWLLQGFMSGAGQAGPFVFNTLLLAGAWLLARGICQFADTQLALSWLPVSAAVALVDLALGSSGWAALSCALLMQIKAAASLWRNVSMAGKGTKLVSLCLALWALLYLAYPISISYPTAASWLYFINALLSFGAAMGLLALFHESLHGQLSAAQADLERSSATLKAILDTTPVSISLLKDRRMIWSNAASVELLGYSLREQKGLSTERLYATREEWEKAGEDLYGQIARYGRGSIETKYLHKDGHELICQVQGGPLNKQNPDDGYIFTTVDITARKKAERLLARQQERLEEMVVQRTAELEKANQELRRENTQRRQIQEQLRQSEYLFRTLTETVASAIFIIQGDHYQYMNPAGVRMLGRSYEEIMQRPFWEVLHPDFKEMVRGRGRARQSGQEVPTHYELKVINPDLGERWWDFNASSFTYNDQPAVLGTAFDITERKRAEDTLKSEKERFHSLVEQASLGISLLGPEGEYQYINPKFIEMFGYTPEDIPNGRAWFNLAFPDPDLRKQVIRCWRDDLRKFVIGEARPRTYEVRCNDGSFKTTVIRSVALANGGNLIFYEDITEQKKLEAQLAHAQKMEAVGTLSGGVAHEFNNILMSMRGYLQLLAMEGDLSPKAKERIGKVEHGTERAAELIQKMLTFSRLESGERAMVDVNACAQTVYGLLQPALNAHIQVKLDLAPDPPQVLANYSQLEQILLNLAYNAQDAIDGPGIITFKTQASDLDQDFAYTHPWARPGLYMAVSVKDTGQGMPPDIAERVFDPFFTTKGPDKGTGLGLAVVYALIHNLGGGIMVQSEPGAGSTFTVYLPTSQAAEPAAS